MLISSLKGSVLRPTSVLGNINWLALLTTVSSSLVLSTAFCSLLFTFYPYLYTLTPLQLWFIFTEAMMFIQSLILVKLFCVQKRLKYTAYLQECDLFSIFVHAILLKTVFVRSRQSKKKLRCLAADIERKLIGRLRGIRSFALSPGLQIFSTIANGSLLPATQINFLLLFPIAIIILILGMLSGFAKEMPF